MNLLFQAAQQARLIRERQELIFWTTAGPTTTFDPKITGVAGTWFFDDGSTASVASGVELSKTFATEGLHRAVFRPASGGLAAITGLEINTDLLVGVDGFSRMVNLAGYLNIGNNPAFYICTTAISNKVSSFIGFGTLLYGPIAAFSGITGTLSVGDLTGLTGSCDQLPNATILYLNGCTGVTAGSVSHITSIRDLRIYNMGWLTADVDTVINSMWAARANYTYATPALQIGGTNQAPTGNVTAPIEGADWHQDGATWIPLTTGAKIYDLAHNVNGEARTAAWTITYTGGSIVPPVRLLGQVVGTGELSWDASGGGWDAKTDAQKFAATAGTLYYFWIKVDGDVNIKAAIYDDNAGAVGNLLGSTNAQLCHFGWNRIAFSSPVVLSAADYWLAWKMDGGYIRNVTGAGPIVSCCDSNYSAAFPEPWTHESSVVRNWAVSGWGYI